MGGHGLKCSALSPQLPLPRDLKSKAWPLSGEKKQITCAVKGNLSLLTPTLSPAWPRLSQCGQSSGARAERAV